MCQVAHTIECGEAFVRSGEKQGSVFGATLGDSVLRIAKLPLLSISTLAFSVGCLFIGSFGVPGSIVYVEIECHHHEILIV